MSPRAKRRLVDLVLSLVLTAPLYVHALWVGALATIYGLWCYYDGITRLSLSSEP